MGGKISFEAKGKTWPGMASLEKEEFYSSFTNKSKFGKALKVKEGDKFKIIIQKIK